MLSGLLNKEKKILKTDFKVSQNPNMNLFKTSENEIEKREKKKENEGMKFQKDGGVPRHINLEKNDYLNKLFNDIKKSQNSNQEKNLKFGKEEVFNDTFGKGGTDREENKENKVLMVNNLMSSKLRLQENAVSYTHLTLPTICSV